MGQYPQGQIIQVSPLVPPEALPALRLELSQVKDWGPGLPWETSRFSYGFTVSDGQTLRFASAGGPVFFDTPVFSEAMTGPSPYATQRITITTRQNQLLAFLYIGISNDTPDQLRQLLIILAIATPLIVLLSSVGGYWLAERATHPVQTITRTAQEINTTDLHRSLNLSQRDEMGELATTFDRMLDRLEGGV